METVCFSEALVSTCESTRRQKNITIIFLFYFAAQSHLKPSTETCFFSADIFSAFSWHTSTLSFKVTLTLYGSRTRPCKGTWVQSQLRNKSSLVRFQVLTAASMKMAVLWVVVPCTLVEVYRRFRGTCCLHHQVWNVGKLLPDYTAQQPRKQPSPRCSSLHYGCMHLLYRSDD
jgi:hypothetical protein